jgi:hypothetical protein
MISEEKRKIIISMWKKRDNFSKISRTVNVSRPTVRKIINEYISNRKFWLTRTVNEEGYERFIINTWRKRAGKEGAPVERLAAGVLHWELDRLLRAFIKKETADEIIDSFRKKPPSICILHVKESELLPNVKI